jgi:hypothetical protein
MCLEGTKTFKKSVNLLIKIHSLSNRQLHTTPIILRIAMHINIQEVARSLIWQSYSILERDKRKE